MTTLQDKTPEELSYELAILLGVWPDALPPYATSYDAIMPEILKLNGGTRFDFIETVTQIRYNKSLSIYTFAWSVLTASPADLTRALILVLQSK